MKYKKTAVCAVFLLLFGAAIGFHKEILQSVIDAGARCAVVIVPSLYLFSVLAALSIRSGVLEILAAPLDRFSRKFLRMDGVLLMILVFSQTAGYPVGTQILQQLRQTGRLSREHADILLCVCVGCGPAFLLGTVGGILQLSPKLAVLLMLSVALPNLLFAVLLAWRCDLRRADFPEPRPSLTVAEFIASVESGAAAMLKICSMILLFAAFMGIVTGIGFAEKLPQMTKSGIFAVLEISNLMEFLQQGGTLPWAAALLSFGGICVHLQNAAICGERFPWMRFWCVRVLAAACSYFLCGCAVKLCFRDDVPASLFYHPVYRPAVTPEGLIPVLCLLVMSVLLIMRHDEVQKKKIYTKRNHNLQRYN